MKTGGDSRVFGMKKEHMKGQGREYTSESRQLQMKGSQGLGKRGAAGG